ETTGRENVAVRSPADGGAVSPRTAAKDAPIGIVPIAVGVVSAQLRAEVERRGRPRPACELPLGLARQLHRPLAAVNLSPGDDHFSVSFSRATELRAAAC